MKGFKEFTDVYEPLELPIGGKVYQIPAVGAADGRRFDAAADPSNPGAAPIPDDEFFRIFLGTAYDEMIEDNVPGPALVRAAMTALADYQRGRAVAEIMWTTGGDAKALTDWARAQSAKQPQDRKPKATKAKADRS